MYYFSNSSPYSKASDIIEINKKYQFNDTYIYIYGVPSHGKYKTKYITIYDEDFLDNYIPEK